jgi:cyclohexyl-isocyanide hydratase
MIIGMLIFDDMTHLDFAGPWEVFSRLPACEVRIISRSLQPVTAKGGLRTVPDTTIDNVPQLDLLFVGGGQGILALLEDRKILEFLRRQAQQTKYVTSVCTGALVLGAAGLLKGYRATTHWDSINILPIFGATALPDRVVTDRNRITGGGVTAGIDFALTVAAEVFGVEVAKSIQLSMEYNPAPPFACGHPSVADPAVLDELRRNRAPSQAVRLETARRAAQMYCE